MAVEVIRDTPEGAWSVLTDLLWLIDGVVIEGLVEVVIPEAERAVTDALVPLGASPWLQRGTHGMSSHAFAPVATLVTPRL